MDEPSKRSNRIVVTTVEEKLKYFQEMNSEYIDNLFSLEKTNASGLAKAPLTIDGEVIGEFTALELLRLKSLLENGPMLSLLETIPVRSDKENWKPVTNAEYKGRAIFETEVLHFTNKTTEKESYILPDPNISKENSSKYTPQIAQKTTVVTLGEGTQQSYTGAITHTERAAILARRSKLLTATIEALKVANDVEAIPSDMTANKLFNYLYEGKL